MNTPESRQQFSEWIFGAIFLGCALLLLGFHIWIRFFVFSDIQTKVQIEKTALESLKAEQGKLLTPELRDLFTQYSDGISALESVFAARDEVFTGSMDEDRYEPVVLLDYPFVFKELKKHLGKGTVLSSLTIDAFGKISFLASTLSFGDAARQIAALQFGFSQNPRLFTNVSVSSISRQQITGKQEDIPLVFRGMEATFNFIVQARINPEFFQSDKKTP